MQSEAQLLSGFVTDSHCFLCEKSLPGINQAIGHMTSRLHRENLTWMKTHVFDYFNFTNQPIASSFYCFVCRQYFTSKELLQQHVAAFPHNVLATAKANLVKNGIREEFALSAEMGSYMDCIICNKDFFCENNANQHLHSSAHKRALSNWKSHLPKHDYEISILEGRWFHCKVCGKQLDGTTEAVKHYRKHASTAHLANGYSSESQTVNNVSKVTVKQTTTKLPTLPVAPSQVNNITNPNVKDNISENKNLLPKKGEDNNADSKLKESVYEQLEKLIQTLYYSKKVPYDVSLQYLKKVNKQVEDIVKEHKSETPKDDSQINALSQSTSCTSTETFLSATSSINNPPAPKLGSETSLASTSSNNAQLKVINSLPIQKETVSQNNVPSTVTRSDVPNEKSISNLLSEVVKQKLKVKQENKDVVEIQVLDEMEILLTEIYKEEAPLAEILKCLEKFNEELDEQFILKVDTGELVSEQIPIKEKLTNGTNIIEPDCKQDISKLTDSDFSVEDPNTKEIIPSMENTNTELVCSETQNVPAKVTYTKTELLNLRSSAKHICINPDMMHKIIGEKFTNNCISYNSIYSYYTATNFNNFMDFFNVYLQCSVDMCRKESWMFQTNLSLPEIPKNQLTAIEEKPVLGIQNFGCEFSFNSFYDYYTGSDVEAFMEFRSQYLYRSIEDSLDLPKEESESNSICENQVPDDEEPVVDPLDDRNSSV